MIGLKGFSERYFGQYDATPYQQPECHPGSCLWEVLTILKSLVMPFCEHKRFGKQLITWMDGKSMIGEI